MINAYLSDFIALFYPDLCLACANNLYKHEKLLCTFCKHHLPYTNFHVERENKLMRQFAGRVQLEKAAAYLYFKKAGRVQQILHQLKYKGRQEAGLYLGERYAPDLLKAGFMDGIDAIIPIPLHPAKLKQRGFNQAEAFAQGLAKGTGCRLRADVLQRLVNNPTQTRRSRYKRFENVESVFTLNRNTLFNAKHILLVDDVVTTGSTLEAAAEVLTQAGGIKISIAALAYAVK